MAIDSSPEKANEANVFIPEEWEGAAEAVAYDSITCPPPICVICGPPNSGKTTFSRHLLNILIKRYRRVAYLDTDVGQAEFTPPGCLSLTLVDKITPDLAIPCLRTPKRCFFFGDITPRTDPQTYLTYIHDLYDHYHQTIRGEHLKIGVPLVVNTPGWVEGYGYNLLVDMLNYIAPTQVIKVHVPTESKNLPPGAFWLQDTSSHQVTIFDISSNRQESMKKTVQSQDDARLLRDLRLLAYFRKCFPCDMSLTTIKELDHKLAVHPPYEVLMSTITIKQLHSQDSETLFKSSTSVVGLADSSLSSQNLPCCVGLGIVTGVDVSRKVMYLITPVAEKLLENVDVLLHGLIKLPASLMEVDGQMSN
ncbi:hypothetical protein L2E82_46541 [Cichorium intybus]|uniref:Uncharacterized protein n=1 Tax=Cichorium intybus TaxID=13427 RepID=A0ACB8YTI0_CICIN|nr:hypothetical protein L1887_26252 [Cichorium endivia]KAI3688746.1 hypothetical protein L2E82_46541 [Cichorium intybus]